MSTDLNTHNHDASKLTRGILNSSLLDNTSSPSFVGVTLTGLTERYLVGVNDSKGLNAVTPFYRSGTNNLFIGTRPLNITGSNNTYFGDTTSMAITSGSLCVGIGRGSLSALTEGTEDTAVGVSALGNITTTVYNTGIGRGAGRYYGAGTSSLTTPSYCTFLGGETRASADGVSNETVIGYNAIGQGNNTVAIGNTSVTGWYMGNTLKVNQAVTSTSDVTFNSVDCGNSCEADDYSVGGTSGATYTGAVTNITVTNGIVTSVS